MLNQTNAIALVFIPVCEIVGEGKGVLWHV